jgi:alcohol dehydrogenase
MKAQQILAYGKNQKLVLRDVPEPSVSSHEVLVLIHAASVNPIDFKIRDGAVRLLGLYPTPPMTLGCDFSGVVEAVGSSVTAFKVGDKVYGRADKRRMGTFAEKISIAEDYLSLMPSHLTFEEAAAIPLAGLTAYQALHDYLNLQSGETVFIPAGSGGVGIMAIQIAHLLGAKVITTGSDAGYQLIESFSPDQFINYKTQDFSKILRDVDAVFDTRGGEDLKKSFSILKKGGKIISVSGTPNARFAEANHYPWWKSLLLRLASWDLTRLERRYGVTYDWLSMQPSGAGLKILREWVEEGKLKVVIDKVYPFEKAQEALDRVESQRAKGKVIVKII